MPCCCLVAALLLPCCGLVAVLLLPCCGLVAALLRPCCGLVAALLRPCCCLVAALLLPCCLWDLVLLVIVGSFCFARIHCVDSFKRKPLLYCIHALSFVLTPDPIVTIDTHPVGPQPPLTYSLKSLPCSKFGMVLMTRVAQSSSTILSVGRTYHSSRPIRYMTSSHCKLQTFC
jgi:hypothetical protein